MPSVQVPDRAEAYSDLEGRLSGVWARQARDAHILVTPPFGGSGAADMLVALGGVGIAVSQVISHADHSGAYELTVSGHLEDAVVRLQAIGCRTARLDLTSIPTADRVGSER